jgi:hypothetical protein
MSEISDKTVAVSRGVRIAVALTPATRASEEITRILSIIDCCT